MTGPANVNPRAALRTLDDMLRVDQAEGWDALEHMFAPAPVGGAFRPADTVLMFFGALSLTEAGQQALGWLFDLTNRAPYPVTGGDRDELAFAAAKHQARAAVGEAILAAVVEGRRLIDQRKQEGASHA